VSENPIAAPAGAETPHPTGSCHQPVPVNEAAKLARLFAELDARKSQ